MSNYLNWFYYLFLLFTDEPDSDNDIGIIGGRPVKIEEVPFFAIYKDKNSDYGCGATIVSEQFLVSAAHCFKALKTGNPEIVVGTDKIHEGDHYDILEAHPHPENYKLDYDVVVIKLVKKLVFSSKVQPLKLAEPDMVVEDDAVFKVIGFGDTDSGSPSLELLQVDVPYVKEEECKKFYGTISPRMICAGLKGKGACFGDSGGPLIYQNKHIGIVSFGSTDCSIKSGSPTVYARVSALRDFIDEQMAK
ncbi:unnamed protein product [Pieris brassicae]|uniref:Peptidase S1 domain-containing protein n=1 Tax=Pieris brassicae TaxID=7116 RepID=A0A9P0TC17_PIEBR|nr:unnamed protein product [Pieris brassicae]